MKQVLLIAMVLFSTAAFAQTGQQEITNYSAERVMKYRSKIELKPDQVDFIRGLYNQNTGAFNNLKWDLDEANLQLSELLKESKVDSDAAMQLMEKVMALESEIKKKRLAVYLSIKNRLTEEQQQLLSEIDGTDEVHIIDPRVELKIKNKGDSKQEPIFIVVDGKETKRVKKIKQVNPDEIKSVEVLKGESAIIEYGKEGKNGVVIIRMKNEQ
ncbi:MAG: hypothetical protein R8G66_25595 [Cytophagales bacterium]|nr:hypothetical protein [Cytophagales bacterium]